MVETFCRVASDDALFASYFWWRNFYTVTDDANLEAQYWYLHCFFFQIQLPESPFPLVRQDHRYVHHTFMYHSYINTYKGLRIEDQRYIHHTCIRIKDHRYMQLHYTYMHQTYIHQGKGSKIIDTCITHTCIIHTSHASGSWIIDICTMDTFILVKDSWIHLS